jgi:hypothetical protein
MDTRHHVHVDEISVWSWVAASVFALIALAAMILATHDNMRVATEISSPSLPLTQPALLPPEMIADPRA